VDDDDLHIIRNFCARSGDRIVSMLAATHEAQRLGVTSKERWRLIEPGCRQRDNDLVDGWMLEQRRDAALEHRPAANHAELLLCPGADPLSTTARGHDSGSTHAAVSKVQWHGGIATVLANGPSQL